MCYCTMTCECSSITILERAFLGLSGVLWTRYPREKLFMLYDIRNRLEQQSVSKPCAFSPHLGKGTDLSGNKVSHVKGCGLRCPLLVAEMLTTSLWHLKSQCGAIIANVVSTYDYYR